MTVENLKLKVEIGVLMIGISTACFYPQLTEDTIKRIAEMGFLKIEVFANTQSELTGSYVRDIKKSCDDYGIKIAALHPYTSFAESYYFFSNYKRRFDDAVDLYKSYFQAAAFLGASIFNFHGSYDTYNITPSEYAEVYHCLYREAKKVNVIFSQENVSHYLSGDSDYLKALSDILKDEVAFTLDIKQANRANKNPFDFAEKLGSKTVHIHINDFNLKDDCLLPLSGDFNIKKFMDIMNLKNYTGDYIIEVYSKNYKDDIEIISSKKKLEKLLKENYS